MTEPEHKEHLPDSFEDWLKDPKALPIAPQAETFLDAVNRWIREKPGVELPKDFWLAHHSKIVCETPRTLSEHRDEDK